MDFETIKIEINTDNSAFDDTNKVYELSRILKELADNVENGHTPTKLLDINGNKVGKVEYE